MSNRSEYTQQVVVDGKVYNVTAVDHSTIDDVIIAESIIYAVGKKIGRASCRERV